MIFLCVFFTCEKALPWSHHCHGDNQRVTLDIAPKNRAHTQFSITLGKEHRAAAATRENNKKSISNYALFDVQFAVYTKSSFLYALICNFLLSRESQRTGIIGELSNRRASERRPSAWHDSSDRHRALARNTMSKKIARRPERKRV
jgi:hypothetical protein